MIVAWQVRDKNVLVVGGGEVSNQLYIYRYRYRYLNLYLYNLLLI